MRTCTKRIFTMAATAVAFCAMHVVLAGPVQAGCCECSAGKACRDYQNKNQGPCSTDPNCNGTSGGSGPFDNGACNSSDVCVHSGGGGTTDPNNPASVGAPLMGAPVLGALIVGLGSLAIGTLRRKR